MTCLAIVGAGCRSAPVGREATAEPTAIAAPAKTAGTSPGPIPSFAQGLAFDGDKAYEFLRKQCGFGPRPLGSAAHERTRDYLLTEIRQCADETLTQEFTYRNKKVVNIVAVFYPAGSAKPAARPVVLLAHWDTRPVADGPLSTTREPAYVFNSQGWNRTNPILGADDGASGTAVLLELAHVLKSNRPRVGVLLLLDDGEDYGDFQAGDGAGDGVELGSRYFAKHYRETKAFGQPAYGILLDMVGARHLVLKREMASDQFAPSINEKVFGTAQTLGFSDTFRWNDTQSVNDDHIALNVAGIPTIDLIHALPGGGDDTDAYIYWHTLEDTPDKCGAQSLQIVGRTMEAVLRRESPGP